MRAQKPRVLWLFKELAVGGAERLLLELHPYLRDFRFFPVAVSRQPRDLEHEFRNAGMPAQTLDGRGHFDVRWISRFVALRRRIRPHLLHLHQPYPAIGGRLASVFTAIPIVYTEHNVWDRHHPITRAGNALTLGLNDRIIAVSGPVRQSIVESRFGRRVASKLEVIHNGIDVDRVRADAMPIQHRLARPSYGAVGHLRRSKGVDVLLRAAAIIQKRLPAAKGFVVGQGEHEPELVALKGRLGITSLEFLGVRRDARQLIRQLDVFVVPSRQEGLPLALLEAMALERPIVATTAGGVPDALTDGQNALLVPPEAPEALADGILRLLSDRRLADELGRRAAQTLNERFTSAAAAARYANVYRALLRDRAMLRA